MRVALPNADRLPPDVRESFDFVLARINTTFQKEHNGDGTHTGWTAVAFNAAYYTGSGSLVWTVAASNVITFAYRVAGTTMTVSVVLNTTTVSGTGTVLQIAIPGGFKAAKTMRNACEAVDNGVRTTARIGVTAGGAVLQIQRTDAANWTASSSNTAISAQLTFEVQ